MLTYFKSGIILVLSLPLIWHFVPPSPARGEDNLKKIKTMNNDRLQELILVAGDKVSLVDKKWWYALVVTIIAVVPGYYLLKAGFVSLVMSAYDKPELINSVVIRQPLEVTGKGIFDLGNRAYSGYVKIRNIEYDWGVPKQSYTAEFKTTGGTIITKVEGSTFILPSSEKLIVFSRFSADRTPDEIILTLDPTKFVRKPPVEFEYTLERKTLQNPSTGLVVSAGVKNLTPFTVKQIHLPVAVYDNKNEIVAVNFTYVDDVTSLETRTFQYAWPRAVLGAARAEITPEINIFDRDVLELAPGVSPFDN